MISIETIIGSAQRINKQRNSVKQDKQDSVDKSQDTVTISKKVDLKLDSIGKDLKLIQTSLTENQMLKSALTDLSSESLKPVPDYNSIIESYNKNGNGILSGFMGSGSITRETIAAKNNEVETQINSDISNLKRLQIETENIFASNLGQPEKAENMIKTVETYFVSGNINTMNRLSTLNADIVMRLTK
ncbi:MAG: hypothetical protein JW982_05305 [Spirochaetes bacterium]|nr:hypothetical protein [Spirochaetota bacterium]